MLGQSPFLGMRSLLALAVGYVLAGKLGLSFATVHEHTTAMWAPTGIALAALLIWGYRLWPGVLIGAFVVNVTTGDLTVSKVLASIGIAGGNTLEALAGTWLVNRYAGGHRAFERAEHVFAFAGVAGILSTVASATVGVGSLVASGLAAWQSVPAIWATWWIGDAAGALVVAPALLLCGVNPRWRWSRSQTLEAVSLLLVVCVLSLMAFTDVLPPNPPHIGLAFLCAPALLWVAFRFGQRETAIVMVVLSSIAIWGALHDLTHGQLTIQTLLLELQAYLGVTSITVLSVAAEVYQRRQHRQALEQQSEALHRQARLLDLGQVFARDMDDRITLWSSGIEQLYGWTQAEAVGKISHALLQTVFPESQEQIRSKLLRDGAWEGELTHRAKDGREVIVASRWALYRDDRGRPAAILEGNSDITGQKRAAEQLERAFEQKENLVREIQRILELLPAAVCVCEAPSGVIRQFNRQAAELWGREPEPGERFCGCPGLSIEGKRVAREEIPMAQALRKGTSVRNREVELERPDGSHITVVVNIEPLTTEQGEVVGAMNVFYDITERKRAEQERAELLGRERAARADAERANRLKDQFLATVSHELRTPLTAVLGWARLLQAGDLDEPTRDQALSVIARNARLQAQLIDEILDVSRIVSGKLRIYIRPVDLPPIIEAAVETVRPTADAKGVYIEKVIDPHGGRVMGDPERLQQVVWNLLSNAVKFTPPGGHAEVRLQTLESAVEIQVTDTGDGIHPEFLPEIFEPFRQADASSSRRHGGLGLGLTIVRHLVDLHGGSVEAQSPGAGRGATFRVRLPLLAEEAEQAGAGGPAASLVETAPSLAGLRVLLVEDEADTRDILTTALETYGANVTATETAAAAFEVVRSSHPDVIVSDIGLPGEDGYSLLRRVRSLDDRNGAQIPALALTAYARTEDRQQALAAGFDLHMAKPAEPVRLARAVAYLARVIIAGAQAARA